MKRIRKLTTAFLVIALLVTSLVSVPAFAAGAPKAVRLEGASRYTTAVAVSKAAYPAGSTPEAIYIASGENFPDALAGSVLASKTEQEGPVLLTRKDSIDKEVLAEVDRLIALGASNIYIFGGEKAVSVGVEAALAKKRLPITRIDGENRYETAAEIAKKVHTTHTDVFLATGESAWDALAIGPYAASSQTPILLTPTDSLHKDTVKALVALEVKNVTILGGEKAVSKGVERALEEMGIDVVERLEGANRELTALAIAEKYAPKPAEIIAVTGDKFPDAIVGAYFGALVGDDDPIRPILLVRDGVKEEVDNYIRGYKANGQPKDPWTANKLYVLGGELAVSKAVAADLEAALLDLPPAVAVAGAVFAEKAAPGDATFTYEITWDPTTDTSVVKLNEKVLKVAYSEISWSGKELTVKQEYLNTLKVGEYTLSVTLDGHAMPDQKIVVQDAKAKDLRVVKVDPAKDFAKAVTFTLEGHYWDEDQSKVSYDIDFTGAVVKRDGIVLNNLEGAEYEVVVGNDQLILKEAYVKTLEAGPHTLSIKLADGREASAQFEVLATTAAVYATFDLNGDETETVDEMKAGVATEVKFYIYGLAAYDKDKLALSFDGVKLTYGREFAGAFESNVVTVTLSSAYLVDFVTAGFYDITATYDGKALNVLTLEIIAATADRDESLIKIDKVVDVWAIVPVSITLADEFGNPVAADKVVEVKVTTGKDAKLSKNNDMSGGAESILVRIDKNGKATVYFQAKAIETGLEITIGSITSGEFVVE